MRRLLALLCVLALLTPTTALAETVTVTPTISNLPSSASSVKIISVALRTSGGELLRPDTRVESLGRLTPGANIQVPFQVSWGSTGTKQFQVVLFGEDEAGNDVVVRHPVSVTVVDEDPQVDIRAGASPTAGVDNNVTVTVSNGLSRDVRSVDVSLSGEGISVSPESDGAPRLGAGEVQTYAFDVRATEPGRHTVAATVTYRTTTGLSRTVTEETTVTFDPLEERVTLNATAADGAVVVNASNLGNAPVERLVIRGTSPNATVGQAVIATLPSGETRTVRLPVELESDTARVAVSGTYRVGDRSSTTSAAPVTFTSLPGRIELTGLDIETTEDGTVLITGSASNVGLERVNSVVVRVVPSEGVTPVQPNKEYFVGSVPASDFVSFDLSTRLDEGVTEIPLEVTYLAGTERRTEQVSVAYEPPEEPEVGGGGGGIDLPLLLGGTVVLASLVVGFIIVGWRRRGD
jgi:hypothetical protein